MTDVQDTKPDETAGAAHEAPAAAEHPTLTLAPTATPAFAEACEICAVAVQDEREREQAIKSLETRPSTTWTMPGGSRAVTGTQEMPAVKATAREATPAPAPAPGPEAEAAEDTGGPSFIRRHLLAGIIAAVAVVVVIAVGAVVALDIPGYFQEVDVADVERVLAADDTFMAGFASDDYVSPSTYELSDVAISTTAEGEDGSVTVDATATLANESFESACAVRLLFVHAADAATNPAFEDVSTDDFKGSEWVGVVLTSDADTRAIAPVTRDPEIQGTFSPTFDEESQTCTFTSASDVTLWFGTRATSTTYTYTFDGEVWTRTVGEPASTLTIDADELVGVYTAQSGDTGRIGALRITNVDATQATFTIEYQATPPGFANGTVSGVISCTISVVDASGDARGYRQADGNAYAFSGEGSSTGGGNTAHIEGYLGLDGTIIFDLSVDYTNMPLLFGEPTAETMQVAGTMVRGA